MLKKSSGAKRREAALFPTMWNGGAIYLYDGGTRPASPDMAAGADPVAIITQSGLTWTPSFTVYGLQFVQSGVNILFAPGMNAQVRPLLPSAGIGWWRLVAPGDDGAHVNYDAPRIDGDVGLKSAPAGQELLLDSLTPALGTVLPVRYFLYAIPPL